uniref:Cytochrome b5 heme-binding domain-containing protein n=1 Tax=Entomoneis paludosa TaxID=265537 RepID=A0A7S2YT60_9STRA|mmetsp:Transcript_8746/g.18148  ORF Transcript_8746/g.18148 Transcript_8746/m.18148 type:complete len:259 (+) Transcript_8746:190-966(+)
MSPAPDPLDKKFEEDKKKHEEPHRNFTMKQLRHFDGKKAAPEDEEFKPVYLSVNGTVFDVSDGRDFYGPEGPYEKFAGRECGVALAKMSFDEEHLDNLEGVKSLNFGEKNQLDEWHEKFKYYRNYPVKGRLLLDSALPKADRIVAKEELAKYNGEASVDVPEGYGTAPIYVGAGDQVFDVSFGGVESYGPDGPYHKFAGKDVSRALACMSLKEEDIDNSDLSDLTEKQLKTLNDWIKTYETKKGYPIVGRLGKKDFKL